VSPGTDGHSELWPGHACFLHVLLNPEAVPINVIWTREPFLANWVTHCPAWPWPGGGSQGKRWSLRLEVPLSAGLTLVGAYLTVLKVHLQLEPPTIPFIVDLAHLPTSCRRASVLSLRCLWHAEDTTHPGPTKCETITCVGWAHGLIPVQSQGRFLPS
jgi:hypothetical protein